MKKIILYSILILSLLFSVIFVNILYMRTDLKYNEYKNKLSLLQQKNKNNHKNTNTSTRYNNIIHIVSKYDGEIKEFKNTNKNINAIININVNGNYIQKFLDELKEEKALYRINSITLDNKNYNLDNSIIEINAEFVSNDL
ncbi:hypothetical protein [Clostridium pasteurianum]|uniref:Uncharacterized protein n=1 Tax=Clostridium pasteurianum BC1 TaxID=86416 RepID=R4K539_CLOPA|nr:hypothetical protein [Clostridium pasteurianum]AGK97683.1 hypothetical protein Clopa_2845 [Clostridium pasteurianum BC1]